MQPIIEPTASLGKLFVDEKNGYIGICKSKRYKPKKCTWYRLDEIENVGLYCTNPRIDMKYRVLVDCQFECDVPKEGKHIKLLVRTGIYCQHHPHSLNPQKEEWTEPGTISIMRGIINQAYLNTLQSETKWWSEQLYKVRDSALAQAIVAFYLDIHYTQQDVENRYHHLSEIFCGTSAMKLVDKYYKLLLEAL